MLMYFNYMLERLEACSLREKMLVGFTLTVVLALTLQLVLIDPLADRHMRVIDQIQLAANVNQGLESQLRNNPNIRNLAEQERLEEEIRIVERQLQTLEAEVAEYAASLVAPKEMPRLLQALLEEQSLQLVNMNNISPILIPENEGLEPDDTTRLSDSVQLYRHGILISLRGEYPAVISYLEKLESQPWELIWHSMKYEVADYPTGQVELHLQTLSTDKRWLGV